MYKGNIHAPKHAKLIYENATAPVFSLISNGGFSWNLNVDVSQVGQEALALDLGDAVEAGVEGLEAVALLETVVVSDLLEPVVVHVEPAEALGDEGEVEPLQRVGGHVEPSEEKKV